MSDSATIVQRLAVLLAAGTTPNSAWTHAAHGDAPPIVGEIASLCDFGTPVPQAVLMALEAHPVADSDSWRAVAAAWDVAGTAGAPIAGTLAALAESLRDLDQLERETAAALAGPVATARLVMVLPPVGVLFGAALGFDTIGVLLGGVSGWACLAGGSILLLAARAWNRHLLRAARRSDASPGLQLDLLAIAVGGGAAVAQGVASVAAALERCGLEAGDPGVADETLDLSQRAGVPAAGLLRTAAQEQRRRARSEGAKRAATLGVTLMLPLALCVLPAFMLLGVAPLMIAVITSTVAA